MSTKRLGLALMVGGGLVAVVGLIGVVASGGDSDESVTAESSSTIGQADTEDPETSSASVSKSPTTTAAETTTTTAPTTTTSGATTTTTIAAAELIIAFVPEFAGWISADDIDTLVGRLHPAVLDEFGEELCRPFVEREILGLVDYRLTGDVTGPNRVSFASTNYDQYNAPVAFTFQGQAFEDQAAFALVDGQVRWFATCR